jgi:hypothetical protein
MNDKSSPVAGSGARASAAPGLEVIPSACEITAYAPDGNDPLF